MEVRRWMKQPVRVVKPLVSIQHARELMAAGRVNQLPVVVDGRLVGIVTDRDLRDAFPSVFDAGPLERQKPKAGADPRGISVESVMSPNVLTVGPGDSVTEAARRMRRERIAALPVVEGERLVGIITRSDLLDCLIDLTDRQGEPEAVPHAATASASVRAAAKPAARRSQAKGRR
jgi:acetoin utilization protein AcuB